MSTVVRYQNGRSLFDQMDSIFGQMFDNGTSAFVARPAVDIRETEDKYIVEAELPGYEEKNIDVTLDDGRLQITAKIEPAEEQANGKYLLRERKSNGYSRSFGLPRDVDPNNIQANYRGGLLILELYKSEEAKPRSIKIN